MPLGTPSVSWSTLGWVLACRPWCCGVTKLTGCAWGAMVLCSAPRVAALVCRGAAVWRPDALLGRPCDVVWCCVAVGVSLRWCLVRGLLRRSCVTALGCVGGGLVRSCVAGCAGDGAGVWGRRELGSGAPATLSGLRRGSCVAGGGALSRGGVAGGRTLSRGPWAVALSRGWYVIGRGVAGGGPWCGRDAERRRRRAWSATKGRLGTGAAPF